MIKTERQTDFHQGFFQIWTPKEGFLILGNKTNSASGSSTKEIKVSTSGEVYLKICRHHSQNVPKQKAQRVSGEHCVSIPGHCPWQWDLGPTGFSGGRSSESAKGWLPRYHQHNLWMRQSQVYCLLHWERATWQSLVVSRRKKGEVRIYWDSKVWFNAGLAKPWLGLGKVTIRRSSTGRSSKEGI